MFLTLLSVCPVCHRSVSVKSFTSCHTDNSMGPLLVSTRDIVEVCLQACGLFCPTKEGSLNDVSQGRQHRLACRDCCKALKRLP